MPNQSGNAATASPERQYALNMNTSGTGEPTVFLHGLVSSHRYWGKTIEKVNGRTCHAVDLLGFGDSPKPDNSSYSIDQQVDSLHFTLKNESVAVPFTLVGHSMGALVAVRYAAKYPDQVDKLVICNTPLFVGTNDKSKAIISSDIAPRFIVKGRIAKFICMSAHRVPFLKELLRFLPHKLPASVKADMLKHTWNSYSRSLENLIEKYNPAADLSTVKVPILALIGGKDSITTTFIADIVLPDSVTKIKLPEANHHIPIFNTDDLVSTINEPTSVTKMKRQPV